MNPPGATKGTNDTKSKTICSNPVLSGCFQSTSISNHSDAHENETGWTQQIKDMRYWNKENI